MLPRGDVAPSSPHRAPQAPAPTRPEEAAAGDVVERARAGDMRAWSQLYHRHYERIYRRLCFFVGEPAVAEDLTQEAFARAVAALPRFDGRAAFSTWLFGIALNVARNFIRARDTQRRAEQRLAHLAALGDGEDVARSHLQQTRTDVLYAVLAGMPEHLREAFVLRELEGLSMADAATRAGVSANNMGVRVHRARERIRQELTRLGWLPADAEAGS